MPGCCGVAVIHGLDELGNAGFKAGDTVEAADKRRKKADKNKHYDRSGHLRRELHTLVERARDKHFGICMATTMHRQEHAEWILLKEGFQVMQQFNNPVHGNDVQVWVKSVNAKPYGNPEPTPRWFFAEWAGADMNQFNELEGK